MGGRQPGADVEELADTVPGDPCHSASQELPVIPGQLRHERVHRQQPESFLAVSSVVVLAAKPEVVHPGDVRPGGGEVTPDAHEAARRDVAVSRFHTIRPPGVRRACHPCPVRA
jgi:hypothetical protein